MGYGYYHLPDGREAGYGVEAVCDQAGCEAEINRGMGYLCGDLPDGHRDPDQPGCGKYFCEAHGDYDAHGCAQPQCGLYASDGALYCGLTRGHDLPHRDLHSEDEFVETEEGAA